ncbi:MAG: AraC family transcriptional regulator [Clostridia bacterium]|nr:AraC family transcriptional regulator [Clostridia bacterium]
MNNIVYAGDAKGAASLNASKRYYEIIFYPEGGMVRIDGAKSEVNAGDFALVPAVKGIASVPEGDALSVLIEQAVFANREVVILPGPRKDLSDAMERAVTWFSSDEYGKRAVLDALGALMSALVASYAGVSHSPVVDDLLNVIAKNMGDATFVLEDYIRSLPLSYDYVRKMFYNEVGASPHEYMVLARIERARNMMDSGAKNKYSEFSVSQISEACGFPDPLYFSRVFKKICGVSPSDYMDKNR